MEIEREREEKHGRETHMSDNLEIEMEREKHGLETRENLETTEEKEREKHGPEAHLVRLEKKASPSGCENPRMSPMMSVPTFVIPFPKTGNTFFVEVL